MAYVTCQCGHVYEVLNEKTAKCEQCGGGTTMTSEILDICECDPHLPEGSPKFGEKIRYRWTSLSPSRRMVVVGITGFLLGIFALGVTLPRYKIINAGAGKVYRYNQWTGKTWIACEGSWYEMVECGSGSN